MEKQNLAPEVRYGENTAADGVLFARDHPGFFTTFWYPFLWFFLMPAYEGGSWLPMVLAVVGMYANGIRYPRHYGVYSPFYFWLSVVLALTPILLLIFVLPIGSVA